MYNKRSGEDRSFCMLQRDKGVKSTLNADTVWGQSLTGCCPNKNPFERALKRFLLINLGEAEDKRFQLFEPKGRVLKSPGASLRFIKKRFRQSEKGFGQQPVDF